MAQRQVRGCVPTCLRIANRAASGVSPVLQVLQHQAPSQRTGPTHPGCGVLRAGYPGVGSLKQKEDFTYGTVQVSGSISRDGVGEPTVPWSIRRTDFIESMPLDETSHAWHHGAEQLIEMILDGTSHSRTRMPVWRNILSEQDAADLVAYMKSLWSDRIVSCQGPKHMDCM